MSFNPISISGYHMREAGATAIQEVGFTIANALEYVRVAVEAGLAVDAFGPRLSFFFASHNDLFEEAAKFRAARRLWARLVRERFGAGDATARLRFHTQTGGVTLQAQQPLNNVVRVAVQALAAALGGTQSLHTNGYDEALALPTEQSATLALRTQQVIAHESGMAKVVDPLAGSYYVEVPDRRDRVRRAGPDRGGGCPRRRGPGDRAGVLSGGDRPERLRAAEDSRRAARRWWSGSIASPTTRHRSGSRPPIFRRSSRISVLAWTRSESGGMEARWRGPSRTSAPPRQGKTRSCRPSSRRFVPGRHWARSAMRCERFGAFTGPHRAAARSTSLA